MTRKPLRTTGAFLLLLLLATLHAGATEPGDQLAKVFASPPAAARPSGFWWWFNNLVDKPGITRDLEEFKAKGLGGVLLVCSANGYGVSPMPNGPTFLSPEWCQRAVKTSHEWANQNQPF
jgi:hypothetical protein